MPLPLRHKRSRSALALSLLHRDKSRGEDNNNQQDEPARGSIESTNSSLAANDGPSVKLSHSRSSLRRKSRQETTTSPPTSADDSVGPAPSNQSSAEVVEKLPSIPQGAEGGSMSLDQSVRTFRLFEVLRSGDTTSISKAVKEAKDPQGAGGLSGTTVLHLAIQCAEPQVVEFILSSGDELDINARDRDGNTPLHLASQLGRGPLVRELLNRPAVNDAIVNYRGQTALDLARTPEIFQQLQLARSLFVDNKTQEIQSIVTKSEYEKLEKLLEEPRVEGTIDVNSLD